MKLFFIPKSAISIIDTWSVGGLRGTGSHDIEITDIFVNEKYVTTSRIGKKGQIKIPRRSDAAKNLMESATSQNDIHIYLKDF